MKHPISPNEIKINKNKHKILNTGKFDCLNCKLNQFRRCTPLC